jgi:hypothetical protein
MVAWPIIEVTAFINVLYFSDLTNISVQVFCIQVIGVDFVNKYVINGPFSYFEFSKTATCLSGQNNLLAQEYL